jgi:hypothetical protein
MSTNLSKDLRFAVELTKVKYTHCGDTSRNPLNSDLRINNERQDYKTGTVCGGVLMGRGG